MSDDLPTLPNPATVAQIAGLLRTVIAGLGGAGLIGGSIGALTDSQLSGLVSAGLIAGGFAAWAGAAIWSWWQKLQAAKLAQRALVTSAVASARAGMPLVVAPSDKGAMPTARLVPPEEAAAAPIPLASPR